MCTHVCVVGAGLTGLSVAVSIGKLVKTCHVTILADSFGSDTISPVTQGLFFPRKTTNVEGVDSEILSDWFTDGWKHHFNLAKQNDKDNGHTYTSGFYLWNEGESPVFESAVLNYHLLSEKEISEQDFPYAQGCSFGTVLVDCKCYMRWLMKEHRKRGGSVVYDTIYSLHELYGKYDIVINCTGKRTREQVTDPGITTLKGHVCTVRQASVKNFMITDDDISIVPTGSDGLINLGYVWEEGQFTPGVTRECVKELLAKARTAFPILHNCGVAGSFAERRPIRQTPLVEVEYLKCKNAVLPCVHNVALGTETLSLAWGVATYVAHLTQEFVRVIKPFPRTFMPFKNYI